MSLTTRLSAFFLAALGVVLLGFSVALYAAIHIYLFRQMDDRIRSAQAILAAAAEIHRDGVEWEPHERELSLGQDPAGDRLRWMIHDGSGGPVDHSRNLDESELTIDWTPTPGARLPSRLEDRRGRSWRVSQHTLLPGPPTASAGPPAEERNTSSKDRHRHGRQFPSLVITVCVPTGPVEQLLAQLAALLFGVSMLVWTFAAFLGRWICQRALAPLTNMVKAARGRDAADAGWSLELAGTGDELDELGRSFNDLLGRLHVAYERQRRFSSEASHQLRTPLTALIGQVEVALRRDRSEQEYRRVLGLVGGQAANLAQIVEALLFLGRAESEAELPGIGLLDLRPWIASHLEARAPHARASDVHLDNSNDMPIWVRVHPYLLGQLVDNLLDNACKYSQPGTRVVIRTSEQNGRAALSVEDAGPGIALDDLPLVFDPFFRSAQARRLGHSGVGLGLAVARRIAEAFGGSIVATSKLGEGSRFTIQLPLAPALCFTEV